MKSTTITLPKSRIITFNCENIVYIFEPKCGRQPILPYQSHETIEGAINYLEKLGKTNITEKRYKTLKPTWIV